MAQTAGNLSAKSLELLPRCDTKEVVVSYTKEQRAYAKTYTADGLKYQSTWDTCSPSSPLPPVSGTPRRLHAPVDFETPILKARVMGRHAQSDSPDVVHTSKAIQEPRLRQIESGMERQKGSGSKGGKKKSAGKRQLTLSNSSINERIDSEQALRLKERRDRKRAKRAITRPAEDEAGDSSSRSDLQSKKAKRQRKKTKAKKEGPSGFSLMYGFTATNVGSHRLTAKHAVCAGVFNKGKASAKTANHALKSKAKAEAVKNATGFSESAFLNHQDPPAQLLGEASSLCAFGENSRAVSDASKLENMQQSQPLGLKARTGQNLAADKPASSITWDIERDDFILPSEPGDTIGAQPKQNNPRDIVPSDLQTAVIRCTFDNPCDELSTLNRDRENPPSVSSIHPSESASQVEPVQPKYDEGNVSRYFDGTNGPYPALAGRDAGQITGHQTLVEKCTDFSDLSRSQATSRQEGVIKMRDYAASFQEPLDCSDVNNELISHDYRLSLDNLEAWAEVDPSALYAELTKRHREDFESWMPQDTLPDDAYPGSTEDLRLWYLPPADDFSPDNPDYDSCFASMYQDCYEISDGPSYEFSHSMTHDYGDDEPLGLEDQSDARSAYNHTPDGYLPSENTAPIAEDASYSSVSSLASFVRTDEPLSNQIPIFPREASVPSQSDERDMLLLKASTSLQRVELKVAHRLKNHWQPQRF